MSKKKCPPCYCDECQKDRLKKAKRQAARRGIKPGVYVLSAYQGFKAQYMAQPWRVPAFSQWRVEEDTVFVPGPHGLRVELRFMKKWAKVVAAPANPPLS